MAELPANVRGTVLCGPPTTAAARQLWLKHRKEGLGASEVSTILGLAPASWGTSPFQLWLEKTDPLYEGIEPTERMLWGLRLERPIADEYRVRHAKARGVYVAPSPGLLASEDHPWLRATPDRLALDRKDRTTALGLIEIKTAAYNLTREWSDGVPLHYQVQTQVQMGVTGLPWCDVVPLLGGNTMPEPMRVDFDQLAFDQIVEICGAWWERHVVGRVPPAPGVADLPYLPAAWPGDGSSADVPAPLAARLRVRERIKTRIKLLEAAAARTELDLKTAMKDATVAWDEQGNKVATWSRYPVKKFDKHALGVDHPKLLAQYTTTTQGQRLTVHKLDTNQDEEL